MQEDVTKSDWMFFSKFLLDARRKLEINVFLVAAFVLLSNFAAAQQGLPLVNFDTGIPGTWGIKSNPTTVTNNWVPTNPLGAAMVLPQSNTTIGIKAEYFMITPQFNTPNVTEIRFLTRQGSFQPRGTIYELRLSTANQPDVSSFNVVLESWTEASLNVSATTYEEKIVTVPQLPGGVPVYLAFVAVTNQKESTTVPGTVDPTTQGDTWFVDNVRVIESCSKVTNINASMTANGGLITWTHPSATNFEVQIVPKGTGIGPTGTQVNVPQYTASNLQDGTEYEVYIKTVCDATTSSAWAGPFLVKTQVLGLGCQTPVVIPNTVSTTPYVLSSNLNKFHDVSPNYTPLDSKIFSCQPSGSTQNWLLGDHAYLSYTPTTNGLVNISQAVTVNSSQGCYNDLSSVFVFDACPVAGSTPNCLGAITTGGAAGNSAQLQNLYLEAGKTYYFLISSPFMQGSSTEGASICFTFTLSAPSCPIPSGLAFENLLDSSANFSWANPQSLVSAWQYLVKPASAGAPTAGESGTPTSSNTINNNATGLNPNTNYNLYVRSVCSGTPGQWSAPLPFKTQCTIFSVPYSTQFTDATDADPKCWYSLDLNKDGRFFGYGGAPDNPPVQGQLVRVRTMDSGDKTNDMLVSPRFHFDGVKQKQIRYKFKGFGGYTNSTGYVLGESSYKIVASTTGVGANNFTFELLPIATYETGNNYVEKIVVVPANVVGDVNIAWFLPPGFKNTSTNFYIDDVYIEDLPDCSPPSYPGVTAGSITQTSAEFFWTNGYNNSKWEVKVQPAGLGVPTTDGVVVDKNPYVDNTLNPSTKYEYYVRAYCSSTLKSVWVGPVRFNTLCDAQPVPYFESFNDDDVASKKFCWSINNKNADKNSTWTINATQAIIRYQDLFMNPFVSFDDYLISAQINVVGQKVLKFKYKVATDIFNSVPRGNFELLMSETPNFANPTVLMPAHDFDNGDFLEDSVIFTGLGAAKPVYFAFHVRPDIDTPRNFGVVTIEDFIIEDAPKCPNPSKQTVANITTNSAVLSWTKGLSETQWEIVVQKANSGVPSVSGTTVNINPTFNATNLSENTAYEYYIRAVCGTDYSAWIGPEKFRTICNPLSTPFIETFEITSPSESCWTIVNSNGDSNLWDLNMPVEPMYGAQMAALNCFTNGNNQDWLITPTLAVKPNQRLRFSYKSKYDQAYLEDLKVKLSTNGVDISQFTTTLFDSDVTGPITNLETKEMVINLTGITTLTNLNIAFHAPPGAPNAAGNGLRGSYLFIDNVIIEDIPACPSVYNVTTTATSITDTSAKIDWQSAGAETSWEISLQPYGTPAPVGNTQPQYLITTGAHPYTFNGLTPSTKYQYYVRAICSSTSQSTWVGPFEILTKCDFSNVCQYKISVTNGNSGQVQQGLDVVQNGVVLQTLTFPVVAPNQPTVLEYDVFLCKGIEFSLYWRGSGSGLQYSQAQCVVKNDVGTTVFTSPLGLGTINTNIYTAVSNCGATTCPQPKDIVVSNTGVLSWTPGGSETQWEVFVQPLGHGSIPQAGVIVSNTPSYKPVAGDFFFPLAGTNEFFVRAVCGSTDKSFWTGPKVFIKNDDVSTAIALPVNTGNACTTVGTKASFIGATVSPEPSTCGGVNSGDIWYEFVATSKVHNIELSNFATGSYYSSAYQGIWPKTIMTLYEVQADGSLLQKACSENHSIVAEYASECTVGNTYKVRIALNAAGTNNKTFDICVSAPDLCDRNAFNYSFEKLPMQNLTGISTIIDATVVPGWKVNTDFATIFFQEASSSPGVIPFEGSQCIQLTHDNANTWDPNGPMEGLYKDFDTSDMIKMKYSFASASRVGGNGTTIELWAGPPAGPFTPVTEDNSSSLQWHFVQGTYTIPAGQNTTRFFFRVKNYAIGHLLDAADFKADVDVKTADVILPCNVSTASATAEGKGQWVADPNNPIVTVIENPNALTTNFTGITVPGVYTYFWKSRYCDKPFKVTLQSVEEVPTVTTPVNYCVGQAATALTATAPVGFSLAWFADATGGIGDPNAPVPSTVAAGTTTYYVALVNSLGCVGNRVAIDVVVSDLYTPVVKFGYDKALYCQDSKQPVITLDQGFTSGGTYTADPAGLEINPATGAIDVHASAVGVYTVTYNLPIYSQGCNLEGSYTTTVTIGEPCGSVPKGISPNGDGKNDALDLSGIEIKQLRIFNRYGTEVYSHDQGYTNQFTGLTNSGKELPDGTYFYTIVKGDETKQSGWVFIIREQ